MMLGDFKRDIHDLARRVDGSSGGIFDVAGKEHDWAPSRRRWQRRRSGTTTAALRTSSASGPTCRRVVGRVKDLRAAVEELEVLLELATEAGDGTLDAEITQG